MSVRAVLKDAASHRHTVLLVLVQVYCYLWDFHAFFTWTHSLLVSWYTGIKLLGGGATHLRIQLF